MEEFYSISCISAVAARLRAVHAKYKYQCFLQFKNVSGTLFGSGGGRARSPGVAQRPTGARNADGRSRTAFFTERASACSARRTAQPALNRRVSR
jgi:hypothetical protein